MSLHPSHNFVNERCTQCDYPLWVLGAHKPCTRAALTATTAGDVSIGDGVDWFALNRSAG